MSYSIRVPLALLTVSFFLIRFGTTAPVLAQSPSLLSDLNAGSASSQPAGFVEITDPNGDRAAVFAATSGSGRELHRTDGVSSGQVASNVSGPHTGFSGTFFWAGEDLDDGGGDTQDFKTLTLREVDVSGQSDIRFSGLFAAGCSEGEQFSCYDSKDSLVVRYSVDGGATFQTALKFSYVERFTDSGSPDNVNEPFARDPDFDGNGEGIELTPAMRRFGFEIPSPASTVIVQLEAHIDGAAEEFAFDNLRLESRPSSVTVVDPLPDLTVAATRSDVVDLRTTFAESEGRDLTFSAVSSNVSIATVSTSNDLDELLIEGVAEGSTTIDVIATSSNGDEAVDTFVVTVGSAPPSFEMDTRIAFADDFCSDVTDPSTCNVVGAYRFSNPRSDTLSNVDPGEKVLVRYILRNFSAGDLTDLDIVDEDRGTIVSGGGPVPRFDSLVVNRIYDAPPATGLDISQVEGTATSGQGTRGTRRDIYGIDVPTPEVQLNTRIARAADFCSDVTDPSTCNVVGAYRFGSPRSDTLANVNPGEKVLVRYIATNRGTTDLTQFTITDEDRGTVFDGPALDRNGVPERTEPFDSLVVNRIYDAPLPVGLEVTRVDVTAEDAGGNADADATLYGIDRPAPEVRMNVRVARAADFCSNVTDPSTCGVVGAWSGTGPRSDTLASVNPGEKVLVRYIATNLGRTTLRSFEISDGNEGLIATAPSIDVAPFDSLVVNRIYDAPFFPGIRTSFGRVEARDAGGNAATPKQDTYGVQGIGPAFRFETLVAPASLFCTDPQDVSTCSTRRLKRALAKLQSDPDALQKMQRKLGSEREVVRYAFYNTGTLSFVRHTLDDDVAGTVFQDNAFTVAPLDSSIVYRIYSEVPGIGESRTATWRAVTSDGQVLTESSVEAPLPVELAAFGAQVADRRVTLEWTTASEENNAGFEVQQFDAEQDTWQVLSFVEGAGTSLETQAYRYDVGALDPDVHRFRLRQVDVSGRFAYSDAIETVVGIDGPFRFVSPAPHPIRSAATADLTVREAQPVRVELFDLLGRRVSTVFDARMNANRPETINIQTDGLASGMYFLRVQGETFRHVERISVVR